MATHDYVIDNSTGANVRADINLVLQAILTNNSSSSAPSTTEAYMWWADTTNGVLKIRNSSNNDWVELLQLDGTLTLEDGSASTPALAFRDDLNTGIFSSAADTFNVATAGVERMELGATTIFNEDGADVDFRIEGDTDANLFYVDAGNNRIGIGTNSPSKKLKIDTGTASDGMNISSDEISFTLAVNNTGDSSATFERTTTLSTTRADSGSLPPIILAGQGGVRFNVDANSERMRIDTSGNVGIGTSSPTYTNAIFGGSQRLFHLTGTAAPQLRIQSSTSGQADLLLQAGNSGSTAYIANAASGGDLFFSTNNGGSQGTRFVIKDDGKVGIGTTSPGNKLHVEGLVGSGGFITKLFNTLGSGDVNGHVLFLDANRSDTINTRLIDSKDNKFTVFSNGAANFAGFVGIGQTNPDSMLEVAGVGPSLVTIHKNDGGTNDEARLMLGALSSFQPDQRGAGIAAVNNGAGHDLVIKCSASHGLGPTEKMRITSGGNVLIGTTSTSNAAVGTKVESSGQMLVNIRDATDTNIFLNKLGVNGTFITFSKDSLTKGNITTDGTNTAYNTSSDYRLKENETLISDGITRLKTLKPYRFNWKSDKNKIQDGFFAHEVTAVPEAISGTKDEVDENNEPVYQGIDQSKLVPLLVAAVQELIGKVEVLEAA